MLINYVINTKKVTLKMDILTFRFKKIRYQNILNQTACMNNYVFNQQ